MGGEVDAPRAWGARTGPIRHRHRSVCEPPGAVTCTPRRDDVRRKGRDRDPGRRPAALESGEAGPGYDPESPGYKNATRSNVVASSGPPRRVGKSPAMRAGVGRPCSVERRGRIDQAVGWMSGATDRNAHMGRKSGVKVWPEKKKRNVKGDCRKEK